MLRLDLMHPLVSGNKWFKLRDNLLRARELNKQRLVSFGGAFSNHLHALAAAGQQFGFDTVGVIRGEPEYAGNPTLADALHWGMALRFVSRADYRSKDSEAFINQLRAELGDFYLIPEGGGNTLGVTGCQKILAGVAGRMGGYPDFIACEIGTGTTFAGLISSQWPSYFLGFAALKGVQSLQRRVRAALAGQSHDDLGNWDVVGGYHFGGFAKINKELVRFMGDFELQTGVALEPVYSAKLLYGLHDQIKSKRFKEGDEILVIHGGGMQGTRGMKEAMERVNDVS